MLFVMIVIIFYVSDEISILYCIFPSPCRCFAWTGNLISWSMCMCSVWASLVQKQRPFSTPKSRILPHLTTARKRASWRRRKTRRWSKKRRWRHALLEMSLVLMALWKRKTLYWVGLCQDQWVLPLGAIVAPLPPGSTNCSTRSASLPGTAVWPTLHHQSVVIIHPPYSAFPLHLLQSMTAPLAVAETAAPGAGGAIGGKRVSRMPPPWRVTHLSPSPRLTTRSWSAPSVASVSPRPRRTSLGLLSLQAQEGELEQGLKPQLDPHSVPGSDPSLQRGNQTQTLTSMLPLLCPSLERSQVGRGHGRDWSRGHEGLLCLAEMLVVKEINTSVANRRLIMSLVANWPTVTGDNVDNLMLSEWLQLAAGKNT